MADLHKFTVQEASNVETAGQWGVETAVTTSDTTTTHMNVSTANTVIVDNNNTIDILFDTAASTNCSDANDIKLPSGVHAVKVPRGLGNTVYFHWRRNSSANATVRVVVS